MLDNDSVLERKVIHAGKPFIKAGEEHARAYIVQTGLIRSYVMEDDQRVDVAEYEPGRIIGEVCLMSDEPMTMNYEAVEDSTVITITRQEFQKKISKMDKNVHTILEHVMQKLNMQDINSIDKAKEKAEIDPDAYKIVEAVTIGLPEDKKFQCEKAVLPHANQMVKAIKEIKEGSAKPDTSVQADDGLEQENKEAENEQAAE